MEHPKADIIPVNTVWVVAMRTVVFQLPKHISQLLILPAWPKPPPLGMKPGERKRERGEPAFTEHLVFSNNCPTPVINTFTYVAPR